MKARVIETGEIVEVKRLYPTIYSRLDKNNKISEEYYDDEIELIDKPKMISLEKACKWLEENFINKCGYLSAGEAVISFNTEPAIDAFRKAMEEQL